MRFKKCYTFLIDLFNKSKSDNVKLKLARFIGELAAKNHFGVFRESSIEAFLKQYGKKHVSKKVQLKKPSGHIVHIFTTIYQTGGHTRFAENLIELDNEHTHHLVITEQGATPIRESLIKKIKYSGGNVLFIDNSDLVKKAEELREFVCEHAEKVILHIHPYDLLPDIALFSLKEEIDIYFFNHADHRFSYGINISSSVINIREEAQKISYHFRSAKKNSVLPLPIIKSEISTDFKAKYTSEFNLNENSKIALSIGTAYKFERSETHDFFRTIRLALEENPELVVLIIGINPNEVHNYNLGYSSHNRLFLLGVIEDPSELQSIADIALDPMPFGSYTALLETSFYGAYPMVCYNTVKLFNLYEDPSFIGLIKHDNTEKEYLSHIRSICEGKSEMSREVVKEQIRKFHCDKNWLDLYRDIMMGAGYSENIPLPENLDQLEFLNDSPENFQNRIAAFFYENIGLFNAKEVLKISVYLTTNAFKKREVAGIVKKWMLGK